MMRQLSPRVVAIIPARFGSQRLEAKPLADIAGKPMVQHVYERVSQAKLVTSVLVATDDERIASAVRSFGGHAVMTPVNLASGSDRIAYVARSLPEADIVVNVQGDEPLLVPGMIDEAVQILLDDATVNVATLVRSIEHEADLLNPGMVKVVLGKGGDCLYFSRSPIPFGREFETGRWAQQHLYFKHIGIYVFRRGFLMQFSEMLPTPLEMAEKLEQLRILEHGFGIRAAITQHDSIPVDTAEDLERVRAIIMQSI